MQVWTQRQDCSPPGRARSARSSTASGMQSPGRRPVHAALPQVACTVCTRRRHCIVSANRLGTRRAARQRSAPFHAYAVRHKAVAGTSQRGPVERFNVQARRARAWCVVQLLRPLLRRAISPHRSRRGAARGVPSSSRSSSFFKDDGIPTPSTGPCACAIPRIRIQQRMSFNKKAVFCFRFFLSNF